MPMIQSADRDYVLRRAKEERVKAITCKDNAAARAHLDRAAEYDLRASSIGEVKAHHEDFALSGS